MEGYEIMVLNCQAISEWLCCSQEDLCKIAGLAHLSPESADGVSVEYISFLDNVCKIKGIAAATFDGDEVLAAKWMMSPEIMLEGSCPIQLMNSNEGYQAVVMLLNQMDNGIYS